MEDTSIPEAILNTEPESTCGVGRPKSRWLDDAEADKKILGIQKMETKSSREKKKGAVILREAKAKLKGP
jgi:hypothetical protein